VAAADRLVLLSCLRASPPERAWRLPEAWWPQYCVYLASDGPERAHERRRPGRAPSERPTRDDYLVRYVKCRVWWTLDRPACHVAVALGCLLYCYPPEALVQLAPALCAPDQIQRIRARLVSRLQARFPHAHLFGGDHGTSRMPADRARPVAGPSCLDVVHALGGGARARAGPHPVTVGDLLRAGLRLLGLGPHPRADQSDRRGVPAVDPRV
jgi:hypothetical protein